MLGNIVLLVHTFPFLLENHERKHVAFEFNKIVIVLKTCLEFSHI